MTLTDIIAKITLFAKRAIVNDNSTNTAVSINQTGSGTGLSVKSTTGTAVSVQANLTSPTAGGTLEIFNPITGDFVYDGGADGIFTFNNQGTSTSFLGGNWGVGTITPSVTFQVAGSSLINSQPNVATKIGANLQSDLLLGSVNGNAPFIASQGAYPLVFFTNATERIRIESNGDFGIGTLTPARKLHVNGTVRLQGLPTYANNAAAIAGGLVADDVYKTVTGELRIVV